MNRMNVSFDLPPDNRPYSRPSYTNSKKDTSFSQNKSVLNSSYRSRTPVKHMSFSPTTTLAEYNQVKFTQSNQKPKLPELNVPQRVELPLYFNTPLRDKTSKQKSRSPSPFTKRPGDSSFISDANNRSFLLGNNNNNNKPVRPSTEIKKRPNSLSKYTSFVDTEVKVGATRRLQDLTYIAQACKRAGKVREEGRAYYSMGVLYDNLKEYTKAIRFYKKFLTLCRNINDTNGEALAYNCLGVDHQLLGDLGNPEMYEQALKFHEKHRDVSNLAGKFTAQINMGLVYQGLGDEQSAMICQQQALRLAVELSDTSSQGIAVGTLGKIGTLQLSENKTRMMAFVDKYLTVCRTLDDRNGEGGGYLKLGQILADDKNYPDGLRSYQKALELGEECNNNDVIEKAKLGYGIAMGTATMDSYLDSVKKRLLPM